MGTYAPKVRQWWDSLRPTQDGLNGALSHTGPNGIYIILVVLSWWIIHATTAQVNEFNVIAEEVLQVINSMLLATSSKRKSHDSIDDEVGPSSKR